MSVTPLISCIMPTSNRRCFVSQSIWYFLRQDYTNKELIIVDDGSDSVADLVPNDGRIRYLHLDQVHALGSKRNIACQISRGEWIAHWDDDDWIGPDRLRLQLERALAANTQLTGVLDLLHYRLEQGDAWHSHFPHDATLLFGGTLFYRRAAWEGRPFPANWIGESKAFLRQFAPEEILIEPTVGYYLAVSHGRNASQLNLYSPGWQRCPVEEAIEKVGLDRSFYGQLRGRSAASGPVERWSAEALNFAAPFLVYDGYGSMAEYLALGMARAGANLHLHAFRIDRNGLSAEFLRLLDASRPEPTSPTLCFAWPLENFEPFRRCRDLFIYTMWETSRLPRGWSETINRFQAVFVPSTYVAQVFRDSGVTAPVDVVVQGADPDVYGYYERGERPGLTTLMVGVLTARKNVQEGVAAWKNAFANDPEARLIIKARFRQSTWRPDDPRIILTDMEEPSRGIAHYYHEADVLMTLGNEGFGLPLVEGMATGLPVIVLNSEGQADVCHEAPGLVLPVNPSHWVPFDEKLFGPAGVRAVPDVDQIAQHLRWVNDHRDEARALGKAASAWALKHRNVWDMGPAMIHALESHLRPPRSLRNWITLWAPDLPESLASQHACFASQQAPMARLTTQPPDLRHVQLLHIFHDSAGFNDLTLTSYVQQARFSGVPVVISEFANGEHAHAWERDASLLIAPSSTVAERLRGYWPTHQVITMPQDHNGALGNWYRLIWQNSYDSIQ